MHRRRRLVALRLRGAAWVPLASLALGVVACVDIPNNMKAQFAPAGPNDRTNYVPGRHGSAPPNTQDPMLPWDAGAPVVDASVVDAEAPPVDAAPPVIDTTDAPDGGAV